MDVVGRWWNGSWGRLARRDVWLSREVRWHVLAREGDADTGKVLRWEFADEAQARAMVERLTHAPGPGQWREMGEATRTQPPV